MGQGVVEHDRVRLAIVQDEVEFAGGQLRGNRDGHEAARDGAEEGKGVRGAVLKPDRNPRARRKARRAPQRVRGAQHRFLQRGVGPGFKLLAVGIVNDKEGDLVAARAARAKAISCHVER